jgi:aspartate kinase
VPAVSRTGAQAGIKTDFVHTRARIVSITTGDLREQLDKGNVVIVAGFQGISDQNQITTFGRGGSDLSAIALAEALKADRCQICTDVDGVYTADPRIVPNARKLNEISYDEMLELSSLGSKVMQSRSVEFANKYDVEFEVCSSFNANPGTIVKKEVSSMEDVVVRGATVDKDQVKIVVNNVQDQPGTAAKVFQSLADEDVNVDMIVQNIGQGGRANLTFSVPVDDSYRAEQATAKVLEAMGSGKVTVADRIAKLSVVGVGMRSHSGVAAKLFTALAEDGINIQIISTSEIKISVAISLDRAEDGLRIAHEAFDLGS